MLHSTAYYYSFFYVLCFRLFLALFIALELVVYYELAVNDLFDECSMSLYGRNKMSTCSYSHLRHCDNCDFISNLFILLSMW